MHLVSALAMRLRGFAGPFRRLTRETRGNVMMILGFALIPLTIATGMAVDYSRGARLQSKLNTAADAAALSGTTKPMLSQSSLAACNSARRTFLNSIQRNNAGLTFDPANLAIVITETYPAAGPVTVTCPNADATLPGSFTPPTTRTVKVTYQGQSSNAFGGILGSRTMQIGGTGTARSTQATYYQIAFIVDISSSMGIGGTPNDITGLQGERTIQCAFACHDPNSTGSSPSASVYCDNQPSDSRCRQNPNFCPVRSCATRNPSPTYSDMRGLAKLYGYKLKIDYVNDAVASFINSLQSRMPAGGNTYAVTISTFGTSFSTIQPTTTDWGTLKAGSGQIDVEVAARSPAGYANQGWTYTSAGLRSLRTSLTNVGDGSSPTSRATYVIFIGDGVEDTFDPNDPLGVYNRVTSYNYAAECAAIKNAGMTLFSIETSYPVIPNDSQYNTLVRDLPSRNGNKQIADVMQGCASSSNRYFMASDGQGIQNAVNSVFQMIAAETSRLTQ